MSGYAWTLQPNNRWAAVPSLANAVTFDLERALVCVITPVAIADGPQSIGGEVGARRRGAQPMRAAKPSAAARPAAASKGART